MPNTGADEICVAMSSCKSAYSDPCYSINLCFPVQRLSVWVSVPAHFLAVGDSSDDALVRILPWWVLVWTLRECRGETYQFLQWAMGTISKFQKPLLSHITLLISLICWIPHVSSWTEIRLYLQVLLLKCEVKIIPKAFFTTW